VCSTASISVFWGPLLPVVGLSSRLTFLSASYSQAPSEDSGFLLSRQGAHKRPSDYWIPVAGSQGRGTSRDLLWTGELPSLSLPSFSHLQDY